MQKCDSIDPALVHNKRCLHHGVCLFSVLELDLEISMENILFVIYMNIWNLYRLISDDQSMNVLMRIRRSSPTCSAKHRLAT